MSDMDMEFSKTDHEFFSVWLRREEVEADLGRTITDEEWISLIGKIGSELDRVDSEVVSKSIAELEVE